MTGRGLTGLHFIPQGQTVTADYYINNILEKEVKPLLLRRKNVNEAIDKENCSVLIHTRRSSKTGRQHTQPRPPKLGVKDTCQVLYRKQAGLQSPDINPVENLWSITDKVVYKDPTPKT